MERYHRRLGIPFRWSRPLHHHLFGACFKKRKTGIRSRYRLCRTTVHRLFSLHAISHADKLLQIDLQHNAPGSRNWRHNVGYNILPHFRQSFWPGTDKLTDAVTALCCALLAVSFSKNDIGMSNVPFAFSFPLPSLYALTLLVTLNARGANLERRRQIGSTRRLSESTVGDTAPPLWISRETTVNVEMMDLWGGSAGKTSQESVGGASPVLGRPAKVKFASIRGRHHTRALPV